MPRMTDSMTEGTVVRWLRAPGDAVRRGEPIVEIETDKATVTYESDLDGVIAQILVAEGDTVPVGTTIATIEAVGGAAAAPPAPGAVAGAGQAVPAQPAPLPLPGGEAPAPLATPDSPAPLPVPDAPAPLPTPSAPPEPVRGEPAPVESAPVEIAPAEPPHPPSPSSEPSIMEPTDAEVEGRVKASPIARRLARKLGIDLATITGTGPGGRIVKEDVEAAASAQSGGLAGVEPPGLAEPVYEEPTRAALPTPAESTPAEPTPAEPTPAEPGLAEPVSAEQPAAALTGAPPAAAPPPLPAPPGPGSTGSYPAVQPGVVGAPPVIQPGMPPGAPLGTPLGTPPAPGAVPGVSGTPPGVPSVGVTATRGQSTTVDPSQAQQVVARRMAEAKATVPEFQVEADVDMTAATALREQLRYGAQPAPSINDLVVKAASMALRQFPRVNGAYRDGKFEYYSDVNIGVVVSAGDLLAVPTLFSADQKGLTQIARESHELAAAVRSRQIQPAQLAGGTFTISNLGMFGVPRFNAIINTPQAAILAVGAIQRKPVVADDGFSLQVRPVMTLTLSVDHRIVYGQEAAEFLGAIKSWLENPHALQM